MTSSVLSVLALALAIAISGCKSEAPAGGVPSATTSAVAVAPSAPASSAPPPPAPPPEAPFTVTLDAPDKAPAHGAVTLKAEIRASKEFKGNTTVTVALPPGAKLVSGKASEVIDPLPPGLTTRTFVVSSAKQLTNEQPVKIVVEAHGATFGARAERVFPER